ncbi:MAG: DNA polymerase [Thermoguttaceae bacterium]|nr:DNA polymerase [Thermoguttaceae bacterium]
MKHVYIQSASALQEEVDRILNLAKTEPRRRIIAVDMEWKGEYPGQTGASLLTLQFSSAPGEAAVVIFDSFALREAGGLSESERNAMIHELKRLLTAHDDWRPRVGGHFLRADLPWLLNLGIDGIVDSYAPCRELKYARYEGGWDTSLMVHAAKEDIGRTKTKTIDIADDDEDDEAEEEAVKEGYGLKSLAVHLLGMKPWDRGLKAFNAAWEKKNKQKIFGFGEVPDEILHPYAAMDADATRRLAELCMFGDGKNPALLDNASWVWGPAYKESSWRPYFEAHKASPGLLEMEMTGLAMDKERYKSRCKAYVRAYSILLDDLRRMIAWPVFNPNSARQKAALLFGGVFGAKPDADGHRVSVMPDPSRSFNLCPVYATKTGDDWRELVNALLTDHMLSPEYQRVNWAATPAGRIMKKEIPLYLKVGAPSPSTDKKVLQRLYEDVVAAQGRGSYVAFGLQLLRDVCKLGSILRTILSSIEMSLDDDGNIVETFHGGHYQHLREDGKIHSNLRALTVTGRLSSSAPNMQNIGKGAEEELQMILGCNGKGRYLDKSKTIALPNGEEVTLELPGMELYPGPVRSIYHGDPDYLLIEADYTGAELSAVAYASRDPLLIEHVHRNALPESDPMYRDMHSEMAITAFQIDMQGHPRTKKGLKAIGKAHYRSAAKAVVFGLLYGRGAKSIAFQLQLEGTDVTEDEVQATMDAFFDQYRVLKAYLESSKNRVKYPGWVETLFGRKRRFQYTGYESNEELARMRRQFANAPIQGTVADLVNRAIFNLLEARRQDPTLDFKLVMQIHDALLIQVHKKDFRRVTKVIKDAMVDRNPVIKDGKPCFFSIEQDYYLNWGEKLSKEEVSSLLTKETRS